MYRNEKLKTVQKELGKKRACLWLPKVVDSKKIADSVIGQRDFHN